MNNTQAAAIIGLTGRSRPTERISAHKARDFGRQTPGEIMTKPQDRQRPTGLMVGQPFNPYRLFTGIFIPEALVRSKLVSPGAKMAYGRLARYAGKDGRCFPAVSNLALEIGIGARQAQKYLAELEKAKLIRRRIRFSDRAQAHRVPLASVIPGPGERSFGGGGERSFTGGSERSFTQRESD